MNRPVAALWPRQTEATPKLEVISGVDLKEGSKEGMAGRLRDGVGEVESVTHVFYFGMWGR